MGSFQYTWRSLELLRRGSKFGAKWAEKESRRRKENEKWRSMNFPSLHMNISPQSLTPRKRRSRAVCSVQFVLQLLYNLSSLGEEGNPSSSCPACHSSS